MRGCGIRLFLYLSREFNFQTSLVNCDCTCGRASSPSLPTCSGKTTPKVLQRLRGRASLVAALIYVAGNRGLISPCVLRTGPLVLSCQDLLAPPCPTSVNLSRGAGKTLMALSLRCLCKFQVWKFPFLVTFIFGEY